MIRGMDNNADQRVASKWLSVPIFLCPDLDYGLHGDPAGNEKGLLMVFNPLDRAVSKKIKMLLLLCKA